ncbi:lipase, putative [Lunatimonas lonarensis]|uniref:Lipase, putative n=1 Tax=Lunatimonas lonarensis TaxID=1232681 RepID=R7ZU37_9BACT|nr:alpha/beta hydrolase [Lunatimonas lonarensis]EON77661.1 lipase, putative [Lunatimonas lonarensis]
MRSYFAVFFLGLLALEACSFRSIVIHPDIPYMEEGFLDELPEKQLTVYAPKKVKSEPYPVLLFIHGGSWRSGNKEKYIPLGRRFARKGYVTVIIDYPLSPTYKVHSMGKASAKAVDWTHRHIGDFGGDPNNLFVSGHSAGGHLAALISVRDEYFDSIGVASNPIRGAVLIDPAGLDMFTYLVEANNAPGTSHNRTFTDSPEVWRDASPMYHLHDAMPPMMIMVGGRTEPSILHGADRFMEAHAPYTPQPGFYLQKRKKHIPMIVQFLYTPSKTYRRVREFVETNRSHEL